MQGPSIHISASCGSCEYLTSEYYAVQSDTGFTHTCALNGLGSHHFDTPAPGKCPFYPAVPDVSELERKLAEAERERDDTKNMLRAANERVQALEEALKSIDETLMEINTGNYSEDDVCDLNNASIEATFIARAALAAAKEAGDAS